MKEYSINKFLKLKLEGNKTNIYVNDEKINQCKYILYTLTNKKSESLKKIESIDDFFENMESSKINSLTPEMEFWGHCSNIQAWAENNYDTVILQSQLAFVLLKKLFKAGDSVSKKVFKEEILKRLRMKNYNVKEFLILNNYLDYLSTEDLIIGLLAPKEANILLEISQSNPCGYTLISDFEELREIPRKDRYYFINQGENIVGIELLLNDNKQEILKKTLRFKKLVQLRLLIESDILDVNFKFETVNELEIISLKKLRILDKFEKFPNLNILNIQGNTNIIIENNLDSIKSLKDLETLKLTNVELKEIPLSIKELVKLKSLSINGTNLRKLPKFLIDLPKLEAIFLQNNPYLKIDKKIEKKINIITD